MRLVIHDLNVEEWSTIAAAYGGWKVISDNGTIKPCIGCFGCWVKTPGECVIKDGYEHMGALIHEAEEVVVISRYTYGGFSSFIKNVIDRSIGFVLPYFEVVEGEMHHKKRYSEDKEMTFIFCGDGLTEEDRAKAKKYVEAVCRNLRARIKSIEFEEGENPLKDETIQDEDLGTKNEKRATCSTMEKNAESMDKKDLSRILFLNCSLRADQANSKLYLGKLLPKVEGATEMINLSAYLQRPEELAQKLLSAERIVLGMPLYVDGVPSAPLRMMEQMEKSGKAGGHKVYVLANMGLYESRQISNLLSIVKTWCDRCGMEYCGGLAIGAGEMMKMMMRGEDYANGPARNIATGLEQLADAINASKVMADFYADAHGFPRALYILAANASWPMAGKNNGLKKKDLLRRI